MEDRKADADTHLAKARRQNTGNGISGDSNKGSLDLYLNTYLQKIYRKLPKIRAAAEAAVYFCVCLFFTEQGRAEHAG